MALFFGLTPLSELLPETLRQPWIVVAYAGGWIGGAFAIVNFGPYLMAWTGERERNHAFAMQAAAFPVAGFLGNLLGGALPGFFACLADVSLDSPIPFRNALLVAAVIELLAVVITRQTAEVEITAESTTSASTPKTPPPYRLMLLFGLISLSAVAGEWTMRVYFNVYLDQVLKAPTAVIGALSAGAQLMGLAAFLSPTMAARFGRNRVVILGLMATSLAYLPIILIAHWAAVGLSFMVLIGTLSLYNPTYLAFSQSQVDPRWRTAISSAISMAIGLGIALTSLSGGAIITSFNFQSLFVIGAAAPMAGAFVFWWFFRSKRALTPEPIVAPKI
jgi:predicted MFS family arabinose efflux permease